MPDHNDSDDEPNNSLQSGQHDDQDSPPEDDQEQAPGQEEEQEQEESQDIEQTSSGNASPDSEQVEDHEAEPSAPSTKTKTKVKQSRKPPNHRLDEGVLKLVEGETGRPVRTRRPPVKFYKGERVHYKQVVIDGVRTGVMDAVDVTIKDTPKPASSKTKARRPKSQSQPADKKAKITEEDIDEILDGYAIDETMLDQASVPVFDWQDTKKNKNVNIDLVKTYRMNDWHEANNLRYCKSFSAKGRQWSSGLIEIPGGKKKGSQNTKSNFLVFSIIQGEVSFEINTSTVELGVGASFFVPPDNHYSFRNKRKDISAILNFVQVKQTVEED